MKKVFYTISTIALSVVLFSACKKDYHCACTFNNAVIYSKDLGNQTRKDAKNQCDTYVNTIPGETWNCGIY